MARLTIRKSDSVSPGRRGGWAEGLVPELQVKARVVSRVNSVTVLK